MTEQTLPFSHIYDVSDLGQTGADVHIALKADALARLAEWAEVSAVTAFIADIALKKVAPNYFTLDMHWTADIVQACVVTLEPVPAHLSGQLTRELKLLTRARRKKVEEIQLGEISLELSEDEDREDIDHPHYDLAAPLLEDFLLAIDPYPRKPGAAFEASAEPDAKPESPFAALKSLKSKP